MADQPSYSPFPQAAPRREAVQGEHLWTLTKNVGVIRCELRTHGQWGIEAQLYRDNSFYAGRTFFTRAEAIAHAEESCRNLLADGWTVERGAGLPMVTCERCHGSRWVCEDHPNQLSGHGECGGAGMPCPDCNTEEPPMKPSGWRSIVSVDDDDRN